MAGAVHHHAGLMGKVFSLHWLGENTAMAAKCVAVCLVLWATYTSFVVVNEKLKANAELHKKAA